MVSLSIPNSLQPILCDSGFGREVVVTQQCLFKVSASVIYSYYWGVRIMLFLFLDSICMELLLFYIYGQETALVCPSCFSVSPPTPSSNLASKTYVIVNPKPLCPMQTICYDKPQATSVGISVSVSFPFWDLKER